VTVDTGRDDRPVVLVSEPGRLPDEARLIELARQHGRDVEWFDAVHVPSQQVLDRVEFLVPPLPHRFGQPIRDVIRRSASLRVIQLLSAGSDHLDGLVPPNVGLYSAAGVRDSSVAELTLGLVLAAQRDLPAHALAMAADRWDRDRLSPGLLGLRVLLVGNGRIAREFERFLAPFGSAVTRVARTARDAPSGFVHAVAELPDLLPHADIVVLILPLTEHSRGLMDDRMLALLPDGALVVNVARGAIVDTAALTAEVRSGRLRAALDVVDPEPMPADHPLRTMPGAIVTPHIGGNTPFGRAREAELLYRQLQRHLGGHPLENAVPSR
jgi:phosphoglycerate dehydrogenase-like enzyme